MSEFVTLWTVSSKKHMLTDFVLKLAILGLTHLHGNLIQVSKFNLPTKCTFNNVESRQTSYMSSMAIKKT